MQRNTLLNIHRMTATIALLCIFCFWTSTVISELFFSHAIITTVKQSIVYAFGLFLPCIIATGITGMKMGATSKHPLIIKKRKRMPLIAGIGLLVMIPSAFFLAYKASANEFDNVFYIVQAIELLGGATNLLLMTKSMKDGLSIRNKKS